MNLNLISEIYRYNKQPIRVLLIASLLFSFIFIIKPLSYEIYPDFRSYYFGAKNLTESINPYADSGNVFGVFLYPPPTLFLFLPLTFLSLFIAGKLFTVLSILCFLTSVYLLLKIIKVKPGSNLGMFLLLLTFNFFPEKFTLGMGQINNFVLLSVVFFIFFYLKEKQIISGVFLAIAVLIKISPIILLLVPLMQKKWKIIFSFFIFIWIILLLSYLIIGREIFFYFFNVTLPNLFTNSAGGYYNQSLSGFLNRGIGITSPFSHMEIIIKGFLLLLTLYYFYKFNRMRRDLLFLSISLLISLGLILTNNSWQHHFVWLLVPLYLTFSLIRNKKMKFNFYIILGFGFFLVALNLKSPNFFPVLLQSHVFYGAIILYFLNLYLLSNENLSKKDDIFKNVV